MTAFDGPGGRVLQRGQVPRSNARELWGALPRGVRRQVVTAARSGRGWTDRRVAAVAVGWAWQVLGAPGARRRPGLDEALRYVLDAVMRTGPGATAGVDVLDGSPDHDVNPLVRHWARRIEAANPVRDTADEGR
ncbi:hypothetical protein GCM10018790_11870 [Kitasatospora xanthocidica]|nr:hypothetical protein GCM10018790_11870 [Kitasatospora xanthocidica]